MVFDLLERLFSTGFGSKFLTSGASQDRSPEADNATGAFQSCLMDVPFDQPLVATAEFPNWREQEKVEGFTADSSLFRHAP